MTDTPRRYENDILAILFFCHGKRGAWLRTTEIAGATGIPMNTLQRIFRLEGAGEHAIGFIARRNDFDYRLRKRAPSKNSSRGAWEFSAVRRERHDW